VRGAAQEAHATRSTLEPASAFGHSELGATVPPVQIGVYPTPVQRLPSLSRNGTNLWIKRDDLTSAIYGGNKVRKIERILAEAQARGAHRILTVGAAGSNYVLALGVFARTAGIGVHAVLVPQLETPRVRDNLRAGLAQGIRVWPARSYVHAALLVAIKWQRGVYYVPPGGSNRVGVEGYVDAARELASQVRSGAMPEPELIVVALGSGGTAAGLAAGLAAERMRSRVLGVTVATPAAFVEFGARFMARRCLPAGTATDPATQLESDRGFLGAGYGHPTEAGTDAMARAAQFGITLDATYTAKAFACALARAAQSREGTILYWHTLSSADMAPLLRDAPSVDALDPSIRCLLLPDVRR
jgi:1-aminocyclopropane-1-carboxylate deaminase/D-cysteine desulfhydrase-like pyridoxal-dependent ACC family enzyme